MSKKISVMLCFLLVLSALPCSAADKNGAAAFDCEYIITYPFSNGTARAEKDLKWGMVSADATVKIPFIYDYLGEESDGRILMHSGGSYGYLNTNGEAVIQPRYEQAYSFANGYAAVKKDGLWGYLDTSGAEIIAPQYEEACSFSEGCARVKKGEKYGYITADGETVIDFTYDEAYDFHEGLACICRDGKYGYMNRSGQEMIHAEFDVALDFCEGAAAVCKNGKWGYITADGTPISNLLWDSAASFSDGYAIVEQNGLFGVLDKNGALCAAVKKQQIGDFSEGLFSFCENDKWGYMSPSGDIVIAAQYDAAKPFSNGLAAVCKDGKWGAINRDNGWAVPPAFADCGAYADGFLPVTDEDGLCGWVSASAVILPSAAESAGDRNYIQLQIGSKEIDLNGVKQELPAAPVLKNDTTMLPIRAIVEGIGGSIDWDDSLKRITITNPDSQIFLKIGDEKARVNGIYFPLPCAPYIDNDTTLVPLRFVTQTLGCEVEWHEEYKMIMIYF